MSHSLTAHLLSLLHFAGCALRVADASWQSIYWQLTGINVNIPSGDYKSCSKQQTHSITTCQPQRNVSS